MNVLACAFSDYLIFCSIVTGLALLLTKRQELEEWRKSMSQIPFQNQLPQALN
jgi:hypothetical protein